jgi:hypothetical protein
LDFFLLALEALAAAPAFLFMMAHAIDLISKSCARWEGRVSVSAGEKFGVRGEVGSGSCAKSQSKEWADVANLLKFLAPKIDPSSAFEPLYTLLLLNCLRPVATEFSKFTYYRVHCAILILSKFIMSQLHPIQLFLSQLTLMNSHGR